MQDTSRYEISHVSRYFYSLPLRGCVMSLCLKPRDDAAQRLLSFELTTVPPSSMNSETDSFGNTKHVLNIHREHEALEIAALSTVETMAAAPISGHLGAGAWAEMQSWRDSFGYWDFTHPSALTRPTAALGEFVNRMGIKAEGDPLEALTTLSDALHHGLEYVPGSTLAEASGARFRTTRTRRWRRHRLLMPGSNACCPAWAGPASTPPTAACPDKVTYA